MLKATPILAATFLLAAGFVSVSPDGFEVVLEKKGTEPIHFAHLKPGELHSLTFSIPSLSALESDGPVHFQISDQQGPLLGKILASGDADFYCQFQPRSRKATIEIKAARSRLPEYTLRIVRWRLPSTSEACFEWEPNDSWKQANRIELGKTVWAGGDDQPYLPLSAQTEKESMEAGEDWYYFDFHENRPQLAFFGIDLLDRDNIPVDILVFREESGVLSPYREGMDPVTPPHEVQALEGNKFTTRILRSPGRYYLRVLTHHPWYQLRTTVYAPPPYHDPGRAVETALDYLLGAGDSWHANTPRKGGVFDRIANYHHETSTCVACHPTHFTVRAQVYATRNGYPVRQRPQLLFLTERFYNNPLPFYGYSGTDQPGASWTRVISAPANVLTRMAALLKLYEEDLSHEQRSRFLEGVGEYLKLYYRGRSELPPDETNGNKPLVSTFEVAWYSWEVLDELQRRTGEAEYGACRDRIRRLVEKAEVKNMIDLCYQTLAFCAMDRPAYQARIEDNCRRILSYQSPSGQWAATFNPEDPEAEFQTGHCLWTLAVAGYSADHPALAKGVQYLLSRQQDFGGWFDPLQSYENFRTPFRESQMAVLALSTLYPRRQTPGWGGAFPPLPERLDFQRPDRLLTQLDNIWEPVGEGLFTDLVRAARHLEPQVRTSALACLGRIAAQEAIPFAWEALGDPSKLVQRSAAWALRQIYSRRGVGGREIATALQHREERVRWGASRIYATHFSELAKDTATSRHLPGLVADPVPGIRLQAVKGSWQLWYWTPDQALKAEIEEAFLAGLAVEEDQRVLRNLKEGLYIIADENIRYLYNNWIPLLALEEDRDRAVLGRLAVEKRLAGRLAGWLEKGDDRLRRHILEALSGFHLRSPYSYDLAEEGKPRPPHVYTRIGNDIETAKFFGESAELVAQRLLPLLASQDPALRRLAARTAPVVREDRLSSDYRSTRRYGLADVMRLAGSDESARKKIAAQLLQLTGDENQEVRSTAILVRRWLTPELQGEGRLQVASLLSGLLASPYAETRSEALKVVGSAGSALQDQAELAAKVREAFLAQDAGEAAFLALLSFPSLLEEREIRLKIFRSLGSPDLTLFQAAVELCMNAPQLEKDAMITRRFNTAFLAPQPEKKKAILDLAAAKPGYLKDLRVISLLSEALADPHPGLSNAALSLLRKNEAMQQIPALAEALARRGEKLEATPVELPDYEFFKQKVQPIFEVVGKDGNACVSCHQTHSILRLTPAEPVGPTEDQVQEHYRSALRVIDLAEPENSLILRKPTSSADTEGILTAESPSHGGGIRWEKNSSPYRTILEWILTARK